ncbi:MAG: hypothetical protein IJF75_07055 [Clostridia bacterium]|nr:hypothetical protein [Clostridia bacterium]
MAKRSKNFKRKKRSVSEIRSYWVGVGIALGHAGNGNVTPIFANAKHEKSMRAGFNKEMNSNYYNTPTGKANLFDD